MVIRSLINPQQQRIHLWRTHRHTDTHICDFLPIWRGRYSHFPFRLRNCASLVSPTPLGKIERWAIANRKKIFDFWSSKVSFSITKNGKGGPLPFFDKHTFRRKNFFAPGQRSEKISLPRPKKLCQGQKKKTVTVAYHLVHQWWSVCFILRLFWFIYGSYYFILPPYISLHFEKMNQLSCLHWLKNGGK